MGTEMRIPIQTNLEEGNTARYFIVFHLQNGVNDSYVAERVGDELILKLPSVESWEKGHENNSIYGVSIATTNPSYSSKISYKYQVLSRPAVIQNPDSTLSYENPEYVNLNYKFSGSGPFTIVDNIGESHFVANNYYSKGLYVNQQATYSIQSVSNACYKNNQAIQTNVVIQNPDGVRKIHLKRMVESICKTDSVTIDFIANGIYDDENEFSIQFYNCNTGDYQVIKSMKRSGSTRLMIPELFHTNLNGLLIVASSHPVTFSNIEYLNIHQKLEGLTIDNPGTAEQPIKYYEGYIRYIKLRADYIYRFVSDQCLRNCTLEFKNNGKARAISSAFR